jgi:exosortase/archaeosortase family protein
MSRFRGRKSRGGPHAGEKPRDGTGSSRSGDGRAPASGVFAPGPVRFTVVFLFLVAIFSWLSATATAQRFVHEPVARWIASLAGAGLRPLGGASMSDNRLEFRSFSAVIEEACDGVLPTYLFAAAVLAFPAAPRSKAWGICLGIAAIFLINVLRVITLMIVGSYWPGFFEQVHIYVWQALVIAFSMAVWVFWAEYFVRPGAAPGR